MNRHKKTSESIRKKHKEKTRYVDETEAWLFSTQGVLGLGKNANKKNE